MSRTKSWSVLLAGPVMYVRTCTYTQEFLCDVCRAKNELALHVLAQVEQQKTILLPNT